MTDTLPNVELPANQWIDLYSATGIDIGKQLLIQNLGSVVVSLNAGATQPTDISATTELPHGNGVMMSNQLGDAGAWAFSENSSGLINVRQY